MSDSNLTPVFGAVVIDHVRGPEIKITTHDGYKARLGYASAVYDLMRLLGPATKADFYDMPESLNPEKREDIEPGVRGDLRVAWEDYVSTPGHLDAVSRGCECPVMDNAHGIGVRRYGSDKCFTITGGCPLHGRWSFE